jgi:hypothetical protein
VEELRATALDWEDAVRYALDSSSTMTASADNPLL